MSRQAEKRISVEDLIFKIDVHCQSLSKHHPSRALLMQCASAIVYLSTELSRVQSDTPRESLITRIMKRVAP